VFCVNLTISVLVQTDHRLAAVACGRSDQGRPQHEETDLNAPVRHFFVWLFWTGITSLCLVSAAGWNVWVVVAERDCTCKPSL
jgi:hypothetical protein